MTAIRVTLLCLAAAVICSMIRVQRPEIAAAISLAVGVGVLLLTEDALSAVFGGVMTFIRDAELYEGTTGILVRAAGITILSELGGQICCDAGESALAGRIRLATRLVLLGMAVPLVTQIVDAVNTFFC